MKVKFSTLPEFIALILVPLARFLSFNVILTLITSLKNRTMLRLVQFCVSKYYNRKSLSVGRLLRSSKINIPTFNFVWWVKYFEVRNLTATKLTLPRSKISMLRSLRCLNIHDRIKLTTYHEVQKPSTPSLFKYNDSGGSLQKHMVRSVQEPPRTVMQNKRL